MLIKLKWIYKVKTDDFGGVLKNKARLAQGFRKEEGINLEESFAPVVPSTERVKISSTNIRLETTIPQKEETFQVIIEVIKNSTCFKAFTISVDVPEIFMQQFWTILNICPIVEGEDFIDVPDNDTALTFLINLGVSGNSHVSKESEPEPEPEPAKKKTSCKRRVKKKVTLSANDNIIFDDLDSTLELAKSISQTEAEEAEAARKVHATHARIVTESVPESAKKKSSGRSSKSVVIQEAPSTPKSKPATSNTKLKGTGSKPGVPDESIVISATSSEGTGAKPGVPDEDKDITEEKVILEWGDEQDSEFSDDHNDDYEKDDKDGDVNDEGE
ncbi:hypothetical protein Tco_0893551 [Tanacetum coccineum]|uniref:Reverse transcriptase Ty1/copia-type domain-containing protein n=1 Tax=Tanacetum coccineum TaxID=301880 RepID=A0ABQ5CAP0_9ASTR